MQFKLDAWCLFTFDPTLRSDGNGVVTGPRVNMHDFALGLVCNMIITDMIGKSEFTHKSKWEDQTKTLGIAIMKMALV